MKIVFLFIILYSLIWAKNSQFKDYFDNPFLYKNETIKYPKDNLQTKEKIKLGKKLFFDPILSRANNISCASCHDPVKGWSDSVPIAVGDKGAKGTRNSPTLLNGAFQYTYFHDGRAKSLEEQSLGPIEAQVEMNLKPKDAVKKLKKSKEYQKLFKEAFPLEEISVSTLAKAIASFERTIVSGNSDFDKWVQGDTTKLSKDEIEGFDIFINKGQCVSCHMGNNFSDQNFYNIGLDDNDVGRYKVKKREFWYGTFKVPTLRNVGNSAPYFHNGSVATLREAVEICAKGGKNLNAKNKTFMLLDRKFTKDDINKVVLFLKTLNEPVLDL